MLSVLASGLAFGLWPAITAAALAAFVYNFLFLPPKLTIFIGHPADVLTFAVFFAVAIATGLLTGRVRDHAMAAARRASAVTALLAASRRLSIAATRESAAYGCVGLLRHPAAGAFVVGVPGLHLLGAPDAGHAFDVDGNQDLGCFHRCVRMRTGATPAAPTHRERAR